jgi:hypothetical protein
VLFGCALKARMSPAASASIATASGKRSSQLGDDARVLLRG